MKLRVKVKEFLEGLEPAFAVSAKGTVKDYPQAFMVTIRANKDRIHAIADGGRMSIDNEISNLTCDDLKYSCEKAGHFTVRAADLRATLLSFSLGEEIWVETRINAIPSVANTPTDDESVQSGQEIVLTLVSDAEQFQTIPCLRDGYECRMPQGVTDFMETQKKDDAFQMRRLLFMHAANKVLFAQGYEEAKPHYLYWIIRASQKSVRFAAGSGQRFAVLDIEGPNMTNTKADRNLLIPNEQSAAIIDIISKATYNEEFINFYSDAKHLVIECASFRAAINNYEANLSWPDENRFMERENSVVFTTKTSDWENIVRGMNATYNEDMKKTHDFHYAILDVNFEKNEIVTKTEGAMKSNRKIPILNIKVDSKLEKENHIAISCISNYLAEAIKNVADSECIQIEMVDAKKPLVFRYYADPTGVIEDSKKLTKTNEVFNVSERFTIFFAPRLRKDAASAAN